MKTLAIISRKGGAGKTTIAVHLAVLADALGISAAVFDLDPQATAALWADRRKAATPAVVPAQSPRLVPLLSQARERKAGLVILDTAPHADGIAVDAIAQADLVLIPCRPSTFDLDAISSSISLAENARKPAFVILNAAPVQGAEAAQARTSLEGFGVKVCPVILYHRKAFSSYAPEGKTANEIEPKGKAAQEINQLFDFVNSKLNIY